MPVIQFMNGLEQKFLFLCRAKLTLDYFFFREFLTFLKIVS